jgi:hypothetical protein
LETPALARCTPFVVVVDQGEALERVLSFRRAHIFQEKFSKKSFPRKIHKNSGKMQGLSFVF